MRKIYLFIMVLCISFTLIACDFNSGDSSKIFDDIFDEVTFIFGGDDDMDNITQNIDLLEYSDVEPNARFFWESSHPSILDEFGIVNRPTQDTWVTLTLYVDLYDEESHRDYEFFVLKKDGKEQWQLLDGYNTSVISNRQLIFQDEFETDELDESKWLIQEGNGSDYGLSDGWGNGEFQWYSRNNIEVSNGTLKIHLRQENMPLSKRFSSARIATLGKHEQTYGRIEARIRLTTGDGIWPAFWMMPKDSIYGNWPLSGEIDIMEARGRIPNRVISALHHTRAGVHSSYSFDLGQNTLRNFHVYALEWQPGKLEFSVDGVVYHTRTFNKPFDQDFYIILNLAYGGKFDPLQSINPEEDLPAVMEIDWIRAYERLT
jgi:hypothetical protein